MVVNSCKGVLGCHPIQKAYAPFPSYLLAPNKHCKTKIYPPIPTTTFSPSATSSSCLQIHILNIYYDFQHQCLRGVGSGTSFAVAHPVGGEDYCSSPIGQDPSSGQSKQPWTYLVLASSGLHCDTTGQSVGAQPQSLWLLCNRGFVFGGIGLSACWGIPWLGSGGAGIKPLLLQVFALLGTLCGVNVCWGYPWTD